MMKGKFLFAGQGAKIPGTDFGLSAAQFSLWLCSDNGEWRGYTTASNQALHGGALIETPVVRFSVAEPGANEAFSSLHGDTVEVTISPSFFVIDGGIATLKVKRLDNESPETFEIGFHCDECRGFSATNGDIHFTATLYQMPQDRWDGDTVSIVP